MQWPGSLPAKPERPARSALVSPYALSTLKRCMDILGATVGLLFAAPILILAACCIYSEDGLPIFYRGNRVGTRGIPFSILKLRTMCLNADQLGPSSTTADDVRVTRAGHVLRKW